MIHEANERSIDARPRSLYTSDTLIGTMAWSLALPTSWPAGPAVNFLSSQYDVPGTNTTSVESFQRRFTSRQHSTYTGLDGP